MIKKIMVVKNGGLIAFGFLVLINSIMYSGLLLAGENILSESKSETPFNVNEVVQKVLHNRHTQGDGTMINDNEKITELSRAGEFIIDTNVVYAPDSNRQEYASVAFDGTNYLVVWHDNRISGVSTNYDIYGARVNQSGTVLDPLGIAISTATNSQMYPSVAFDGTNYLVVWQDYRNGTATNYDIYGARIAQNGTVVDLSGIAISTATNIQQSPLVAFDGTNYLVVWQDRRNSGNNDIYGARVAQNGSVLDPSGIAISTATNSQLSPSVSFDGTNYLVVWQDYRSGTSYDIYGTRVAQGGTVLDPNGIAVSSTSNSEQAPSVAFDGTNYLVVWHNYVSGNSDIYGVRVAQDGTVLDPSGIAISTATSSQTYPSVAFDGTNYLVVWQDNRSGNNDIYGARVAQDGTVLDPSGIAISTATNSQEYPSVASGSTNCLVVWTDYRSGTSYDIYGARVAQNGSVLDPSGITISSTANKQYYPSGGFDGTNYLVVWQDYRDVSYYDIFAMRVGQSGASLDPSGIAISTAENNQMYPSVGFDNTNYLVVWQDRRSGSYDIYGARVAQNGSVLDPSGIAISTATDWQLSPSVAFDGTNYLVVWSDFRSGTSYDIYGARVAQNGTILDASGIAISTATNAQEYPSVAFDGTNYLVVWQDFRSGSSYDIYGARVTQNGTVLDPSGIAISTATNSQEYPSGAFDGSNYLVVWQDYRSGSYDIYGARVAQNGTILDPSGIAISTAADSQASPSVAFGGTNYVVVWQDKRSGTSYDIYLARVSTSGAVLISYPLSTQTGNQISPVLARCSETQLLAIYSGYADSINSHFVNTMRIWGKFYSSIGVEEGDFSTNRNILKRQIFSNPSKSSAKIRYVLEKSSDISLKVYNTNGQLVATLANKRQNPGAYEIIWAGEDDFHRKLPQGVYFLRIDTEGYNETQKLVLLQ